MNFESPEQQRIADVERMLLRKKLRKEVERLSYVRRAQNLRAPELSQLGNNETTAKGE
jgi:hypothetical protein